VDIIKPLSRQRKWQIKMMRLGKCQCCGQPRVKSSRYCDKHLAADNQRQKVRYKQKKESSNGQA
jgi:hypothetical protein